MEQLAVRLTVFFEEPFWVGVYERREGGRLTVCRVVFGAEPKDYEVHALLLQNWERLRFSPPVEAGEEPRGRQNPKRVQRTIGRQLEQRGAGTKAQQALKLQQEQGKEERKETSRVRIEAEKERRFLLRQEKKKEKHRGR